MDCGGTFAKYVLFLFNILFVICGILLITFGSIMVAHMGDLHDFSDVANAHSISIAIIVLGSTIFIISFLGCCGAIRENICCTMTYSVIMLVLFLLQLALVIYIWVQRAEVLNTMSAVIDKAWTQRHQDGKFMDVLQISFTCCGKNGFSDYSLAGETIPNSCCGDPVNTCPLTTAMTKPGCMKAFLSFWEKNTDITRYAGLGVALVELIAFIFACCLANQVKNSRRRAGY